MAIRNAAKAVIVCEGKVLVNRCISRDGFEYSALPGGGQRPYETMQETLVRECLEETGYLVKPGPFVALYEEIYKNDEVRAHHPDYAHKIYHVFLCELEDMQRQQATEMDENQRGIEWIPIADLHKSDLIPVPMQQAIIDFLQEGHPRFLGSVLR